MASAVSSLLGSSTPPGATPGAASNSAPSEQMFLQLLVSQLKNQDPLNPADGTQFVSQLAQFSELEQVIAIRGDIESATGANPTSGAAPGSSTAPGSTTPANTAPGPVLPGSSTAPAASPGNSQPTA